jgi:signal transduction histidine kinase/AmiR/NasT family two-component response regulator
VGDTDQRMRSWKKKPDPVQHCSVASAALAGASHEEILREALATLVRSGGAERFGLWLAAATDVEEKTQRAFRGAVWDADSETTPKEWMQLAPQFPLPRDLLLNGKSILQEVKGTPESPLLGPLAGLGRVLWVPVQRSGRLYGILLAGSRSSSNSLPREQLETIASELSLALALESENLSARRHQADLAISRRVYAQLTEGTLPETVLTFLAESCTEKVFPSDEPLAVFAAIGRRESPKETLQGQVGEVEFPWKSGATPWPEALAIESIAEVWRGALESGRTKGSELHVPWSAGEIVRAVAIPLLSTGYPLGVLVVMIRSGTASLATLERLELRATLAAAALAALCRREEDSRRDAELQILLDANSGPLAVVSREGKLLRTNRAARELLGEGPQGEAGLRFSACIGAGDRTTVESWLSRLGEEQRGSLPEALEAELGNGKRILLRPIHDSAGNFLLLALEPVEALPRKEDSREATELLTLVEWLDQGVILFDAQEQIRVMNMRFAQLAGLSPEETDRINSLEGLIARLGPHAAEPDLFAGRWWELSRGAEGGVREEVHLARPISRVLERVSRPVLDAGGRKLGRIEIYRDLTAQRIFQARLLQTEKLAALGQMVSGVAHELSNPLTSVVGYAQRLLMRPDALSHSEEVHRIFAEAERASAILRRLLLSARDTPPEKQVLALNQLVQRTVELQRFSLTAEKIRVEMDLDPLLPPVRGDAGQLQQVLMNLLGNARQAMEEHGKGGTIRLKTERVAGRRVRLEVSDTGPGIPEPVLARIFDPFFTTKPAGAGTGLGLSIVLSIVREHGGQVYVKSSPGKGAVFSIELPATAETREPAAERKQRTGKSGVRASVIASGARGALRHRQTTRNVRRVLVVEDEPTVAQLIADVLRDEGFQVESLPDGRNAPERAASTEFALVICDMKMPNLDGQHFYRSLALAGNPLKDRFLFVTGDVLAAQTREFLERNRLPYVAKPFRVEELTEKVERVLSEAEHAAESSVERKNAATKG